MKERIIKAAKYILKGTPINNITAKIGTIYPSELLKNKSVLITGGNRGLGKFIAKKCVAEGANVLITGRNEDSLKKTADEIGCKYIKYDLTNFEEIQSFFEQAVISLGGKIDCLINNAGISLHEGSMQNVSEQTYDLQFNTNLKAPYFLSKLFVEHILTTQNTNSSIIFMASERGLFCDDIPYGLIKAAIISLTRAMARRHIAKGLRVNAIAPGITTSDMTSRSRNESLDSEYNCGGRVFLPEEIAEVAIFLMSDASKCISGEVIACDQGNYLRSDW